VTVNGSDASDDRIFINQSGGFISVSGNKAGFARQPVLIQRSDGSMVDRVPIASVAGLLVDGKAGNDAITLPSTLPIGATLLGGAGNDTITGGAGADSIEGGTG